MIVNKWSDVTPVINKIDVLKIVPNDEIIRGCWRADRHHLARSRALDEIHCTAGCGRRSQHPNKAPQRTLSDRALDADLGAADPADAAPADAPRIAPDSAKPDGFVAPKTPRHDRKVAGECTKAHSQRRCPTLGPRFTNMRSTKYRITN